MSLEVKGKASRQRGERVQRPGMSTGTRGRVPIGLRARWVLIWAWAVPLHLRALPPSCCLGHWTVMAAFDWSLSGCP